jgi:HTH-type transcriptional regulator/antitoxin MqsA
VLTRGVRRVTLIYRYLSRTIDMPGWYPEGDGDGLHTGEDLAVSDAALRQMKAEVERRTDEALTRRARDGQDDDLL